MNMSKISRFLTCQTFPGCDSYGEWTSSWNLGLVYHTSTWYTDFHLRTSNMRIIRSIIDLSGVSLKYFGGARPFCVGVVPVCSSCLGTVMRYINEQSIYFN